MKVESNLLHFISIEARYHRARFFYKTSGGKVSWRRIMEEVEVREATAKRWESIFKEEWRKK